MAEASVGDEVVPLMTTDILEMTVDELRYELQQRGGSISGRNKSQLQAALTSHQPGSNVDVTT